VPEVFLSYADLRGRGIKYCRLHLNRLIQKELFPEAVWLSPNRKAWKLRDIERFERERPTNRPSMPAEKEKAADTVAATAVDAVSERDNGGEEEADDGGDDPGRCAVDEKPARSRIAESKAIRS
jgi:hypothetical protein